MEHSRFRRWKIYYF